MAETVRALGDATAFSGGAVALAGADADGVAVGVAVSDVALPWQADTPRVSSRAAGTASVAKE